MTKQRARASLVGLAMLLFATTLAAQVTEEWVARYDGSENGRDVAVAIALDGEGNVYVTGESKGTTTDYVTIKYDPTNGMELWVAPYNGPGNGKDEPYSIAVDVEGNVYVAGDSYGGENTGYDYATIKYNADGHEEWVARYDGPANDSDGVYSIAVDDSGNVYVTGYSIDLDPLYRNYDCTTIKYDSEGKQVWISRYEETGVTKSVGYSIAVDDSGNVYAAGYCYEPSTNWDYLTIKYNAAGEEQWTVRYNRSDNSLDWISDMALDGSRNILVTGASDEGSTIVKYNSVGEEQWVRYYNMSILWYITVDKSSYVYVTGGILDFRTDWDYTSIKYNSVGDEQWISRYNAPADAYDIACAIAFDSLGNVYVTGASSGLDGDRDYATIKYNSAGEEQWVARYDGPWNVEGACDIAVDPSGNVYVTGYSTGSNDYSDYVTIKYRQGPSVAEASPEVAGHRLEVAQLAPQPVITYTLPADTRVSLKVYDVTGKLVRTLVSGSQEAGTHTACWDARNDSNQQVSAGLYFILLETKDFRVTGKLVVVRQG